MTTLKSKRRDKVNLSLYSTKIESEIKYLNVIGDKMEGDIDMQNKKIINLPTPTNDDEASTKKYVDDKDKDNITRTKTLIKNDRPLANHLEPLSETLKIKRGIDMNQNKLENLPDIEETSNSKQAVNKLYVDHNISSLKRLLNGYFQFDVGSLKLLKPININNMVVAGLPSPTNPSEAANKNYCDTISTSIISRWANHLQFDTNELDMLKSINMNNYRINNLAAPSDSKDAVNKETLTTSLTNLKTETNTKLNTLQPKLDNQMTFTSNLITVLLALSMSDKVISCLANPTNSKDAANKEYVDNAISTLNTNIQTSLNEIKSQDTLYRLLNIPKTIAFEGEKTIPEISRGHFGVSITIDLPSWFRNIKQIQYLVNQQCGKFLVICNTITINGPQTGPNQITMGFVIFPIATITKVFITGVLFIYPENILEVDVVSDSNAYAPTSRSRRSVDINIEQDIQLSPETIRNIQNP
jgi:hypothetical protein